MWEQGKFKNDDKQGSLVQPIYRSDIDGAHELAEKAPTKSNVDSEAAKTKIKPLGAVRRIEPKDNGDGSFPKDEIKRLKEQSTFIYNFPKKYEN